MKELIRSRYLKNQGLAAFNVTELEQARIFIRLAKRRKSPLVLQISENTIKHREGLADLVVAIKRYKKDYEAPVVIHLDHATNLKTVKMALDLGIKSVMIDGSNLPYQQNLDLTRQVVEMSSPYLASVEAELGEIPGKPGAHQVGARTNLFEAKKFVQDSEVDSLAVAVGNEHAMSTQTALIDFTLIENLRAELPVPLVLHGSSGLSDDNLKKAVTSGITKINIATRLNITYMNALREFLRDNPNVIDPRKLSFYGLSEVQNEANMVLELIDPSENKIRATQTDS